jgi:hypothetical protein
MILILTSHSTLAPILFEVILFLHAYHTLWNVRIMQILHLAVKDEEKGEQLRKKLQQTANQKEQETVDLDDNEDGIDNDDD